MHSSCGSVHDGNKGYDSVKDQNTVLVELSADAETGLAHLVLLVTYLHRELSYRRYQLNL